MADHSMLPASSAARWTACTPSALQNAKASGDDRASPYAKQGTDAHSLCQYLVEKEYGIPTRDPTEDLTYYDEEMQECAEVYLATIKEFVSKVNDPVIFVEQRVDFGRWVPDGFGTADYIILSEGAVHICDYKHGAGILVEAEDNVQMKCYALGAISMTVIQPRKDNISTWTVTKAELLDWAENFLAPRALLASKGEGVYVPGSHCQFCRIKATCRARAEANLELAKDEFRQPPELEDEEIADILGRIDGLVSWANDVKEYALTQALAGKKYEGYKLVAGRSVRKYTDETAVADAVAKAGYNPFERKLLGVTAMTSLLGQKRFEEILGDLTVKPLGKPTLVADSDKRPEINSAAEDFKD